MTEKPRLLILADLKPSEMMDELARDFEIVRDINAARDVRAAVSSGTRGLSRDDMDRLPNLGLLAVNGVGVDAIDLPEAAARGVAVTTTPGVLSDAVAELALGLALAALRRIAEGDRMVRAGDWENGQKARLGRSIFGRRAGIFGYGRIGRRLAGLLRGLGVEVFYTDLSAHADDPDAFVAEPMELARNCDLFFVTVAGGERTRHLIDADLLAALGSAGILINVARGSIVDGAALADALRDGRLGAAALDVFEEEPVGPSGADAALLRAPNTVLTPHVASATVEARRAMADTVIANLRAFFADRPLVTPYN